MNWFLIKKKKQNRWPKQMSVWLYSVNVELNLFSFLFCFLLDRFGVFFVFFLYVCMYVCLFVCLFVVFFWLFGCLFVVVVLCVFFFYVLIRLIAEILLKVVLNTITLPWNMELPSIDNPLYATMRRAGLLCRLIDPWKPLPVPRLRILCHGRNVIRAIE